MDLLFPSPESNVFRRAHTIQPQDSVQAEKIGSEQVCDASNNGNTTEWSCTHDGGASLAPQASRAGLTAESETIRIFAGAGATHLLTVKHQFSKDDASDEGGDHRANLKIAINGEEKGRFKHNPNRNKEAIKIEEADGDWSINPYYNGNYFVEIDCDDECNCNVVKKAANCRLKVEAIYEDPGLAVDPYG